MLGLCGVFGLLFCMFFCLIIILKFSYFYYIWRLKIHDLLEIWGNKCLTPLAVTISIVSLAISY